MHEPGEDSCDGERNQNAAVDAGSPPSSGDSGHAMSVDERNAAIRAELEALTKATFEREPGLESQTLAKLSGEASTLQKEGRYLEAVAAYNKVFAKSRLQNVGVNAIEEVVHGLMRWQVACYLSMRIPQWCLAFCS